MSKVDHIVLIRFKEGTLPETLDKIFDEFLDISETIPGIENFVSGPNTSPEGLNQGYTHAFVMTFCDSLARDAYLHHPEHERVKKIALEVIDSVLVVDFEF
ncbi:MAG: hypothetical protein M2R45_00667 [Verrucomicrobia subdivision 3 bacterium]|nr:hypothetical protein [Limisphaerales bacterium]MCS1414449.1 hypothetical protein [Limisphaerales bacterium]